MENPGSVYESMAAAVKAGKAGEGEDEKSYAVTVDATGDTPELAVEEVSEEAEE